MEKKFYIMYEHHDTIEKDTYITFENAKEIWKQLQNFYKHIKKSKAKSSKYVVYEIKGQSIEEFNNNDLKKLSDDDIIYTVTCTDGYVVPKGNIIKLVF